MSRVWRWLVMLAIALPAGYALGAVTVGGRDFLVALGLLAFIGSSIIVAEFSHACGRSGKGKK